GSDDRSCVVGRHRDRNVLQRMRFSEPGVQMLDLNANPHQFAPFSMPRPATKRTAPTETTMRIIRIRAPAQACRCHSSNGEMAKVNIDNGSAAVGEFPSQFTYRA